MNPAPQITLPGFGPRGEELRRGAEFSECGTYRYALWASWDLTLPQVAFVGCNPSTAGRGDRWWDLTARKFEGFAQRLGFGSWSAVNMFGLVDKDPEELARFSGDRVGPENDATIVATCRPLQLLTNGSKVVACWGAPGGAFRDRVEQVLSLVSPGALWCLGRTKDGHPRHPSRLPYSAKLEPFAGPANGGAR